MSQLTKQQLKGENQTQFPNNNVGAITPSNLRAFNVDMIDSTVNQTDFTNFSGSVASEITTLQAEVVALENFSASLSGGFVTEGELQAATASLIASINTKLDTTEFNAYTQSTNVAIAELESWSSSLDVSAITASSLQTASFTAQTLTFTKGDGSQFSIFIPDQSGSTGNFATTGSNSFNGNQIITGSVFISSSATSDLVINGQVFISSSATGGTTRPQLIVSGSGGQTQINRSSVSTRNLTNISFINPAYFGISGIATTDEIGITLNPSAVGISGWTGGGAIYVNDPTDTFPAVIGFQDQANWTDGRVTILTPLVASSSMTASNTLISGDLTVNPTTSTKLNGNTDIGAFLYINGGLTLNNTAEIRWVGVSGSIDSTFSQSVDARINAITGGTAIDTGSFATTGSNTFTGNQTIDNSSGGQYILTAGGLPVYYGQTAAGNFEIAQSGSALMRASGFGNTEHFWTSSFNNRVSILNGGVLSITGQSGATQGAVFALGHSGSLVLSNNNQDPTYTGLAHLSSSQAQGNTNLIFKNVNIAASTQISGSNNIFGNPTSTPTTNFVRYIGGNANIMLSGVIPQITGSAASISGNRPGMTGNIIPSSHTMTINQSSTPGTWNINSNFLNNAGSTTINALGNTGTFTFSGNIASTPTITINSPSRSIAEINAGATGSNAFNMQNNLMLNPSFTYNGPVSSSLHTFSNNVIGGGATLNLQSGSRGYNIANNNINGTIIITDNTVFAPTLGSTNSIQGNNIIGGATFTNRASSSISAVNNLFNSPFITSDLDASQVQPAGQRVANTNLNIVFGTQQNIYFSGSLGAVSGSRAFNGNLMMGIFNSASLVGDGNNKNIIATTILGGGLNVIGSNPLTFGQPQLNIGSAFFGRYNAEGVRASTAETVFAVGTGVSSSLGLTRKTGFLIDSGSNTFIEGTLNVSGATSLNGNLIVTGSLTASLATGFMYVGANGLTEAIPTASFTASLATNATDIVVNVKNTTGAQINKGTVVRIIGATGDNALIGTASWEDDNNSANTLGFVVADIQNDGFGRVMTQGTLLAVNTDPALGFAAGDIVYLSGSGQYTNVKPPAPYHEVRLGQVLRAQQNNGSIYVLIQNGYELSELHDVDINTGSLANNDLLAYDSASTQWTNKSIASLGIQTTGSLNSGTVFATVSQSGSANVSQSIQFGVTGSMHGVSLVSGSQLQVADSGLYSLTISTQWVIDLTMDNVHLWVMKNGSNVLFSSQRQAYNGSFTIQDQANANDYYEFVWEGTQGDAVLQAANASGNIPATPCAIASIQQIR